MKKIILSIFLFALPLAAQTTVAIGDFQNESDRFFLNDWEKQIPDFLHEALSGKPGIVLVARHDLAAVLEEHALSLTGRIDSTAARMIGKLISAAYLITGTIHETSDGVRIDARIIHTATGRMIAEKVEAPYRDKLAAMIELLAGNITWQLTGQGEYVNRIAINPFPVKPFAVGTAVSLVASLVVHASYHSYRDDYQNATDLNEFDSAYDKANSRYKTRNALYVITAAGALGTLICWLGNRTPQDITASNPPVEPRFSLGRKEATLGLSIHF